MAKKDDGAAVISPNFLYAMFPQYQKTETTTLALEQVEFKTQAEPDKDDQEGTATIIVYIQKDACANLLDTAFGGFWQKKTGVPYAITIEKKDYTTKPASVRAATAWGYICNIEVIHPTQFTPMVSRDGHADATHIEAIKGGESGAFKRAAAMWLQNVRDLRKCPKFNVQCVGTNKGLKSPNTRTHIAKALAAAYTAFLKGEIAATDVVYITTNNTPETPINWNQCKADNFYVLVNGNILWAAKMRPLAELQALLEACLDAQALHAFWNDLSDLETPLISNEVAILNGQFKNKLLDLVEGITSSQDLDQFQSELSEADKALCAEFLAAHRKNLRRTEFIDKIQNIPNTEVMTELWSKLSDASKAEYKDYFAARKKELTA